MEMKLILYVILYKYEIKLPFQGKNLYRILRLIISYLC